MKLNGGPLLDFIVNRYGSVACTPACERAPGRHSRARVSCYPGAPAAFRWLVLSRSLPGPSGLTRRNLGVLAALPAIIPRSATAARPVTFAGYGSWFQTAFDSLILQAFRKAHPDIPVVYYSVGNSFQSLGLLRGQRTRPSTDIVLMEPAVAAQANAEGLLEPLTSAMLPVMADLIPQAMQIGLAGPALMLDSLVLGYNPALSGRAPRLWRQLWDPAYGRRIALQTPPDPIGLAMTAVGAALFGRGDPETALDIALNALGQLGPRVAVWDPVPDTYSAIAAGDADIGPCWNARAQNQAGLTPGRFAAIYPEEGSPYLPITVNLVKGSAQSDAARTLIAWLLGPEAQRLLTATMNFAPVNTTVTISAALLVRAGATPAMAARRVVLDWVAVTAVRDQFTAAWRDRGLANH
jgi:putative spermidine/putrescine transport system substrate-binding protein